MWTMGLPGYLDDLYDEEDDGIAVPVGMSSEQISRIQKGAEIIKNEFMPKVKFSEIHIIYDKQHVKIGEALVSFETCMDALENSEKIKKNKGIK